MDSYVVDASVGAKWFLEEQTITEANQLLLLFKQGKAKIVVPELFYIEMSSVLRKRINGKTIGFQLASNIQNELSKLEFERYSDHELVDIALENAVQFGISAYDAIYISLAEIYVAPFVTADEVLIRACKDQFDFILPLKEFGRK